MWHVATDTVQQLRLTESCTHGERGTMADWVREGGREGGGEGSVCHSRAEVQREWAYAGLLLSL